MATVSNRAAVIAQLVTLMQDSTELAGVQVGDGSPANPERDAVWVGDVHTVNLNLSTMGTATRHQRIDHFAINVHLWAGQPGQSAGEARARVEELYAGLENILATNSTLSGVDGLLDAVATDFQGPLVDPQDTEGYSGMGTIVVECRSQLI